MLKSNLISITIILLCSIHYCNAENSYTEIGLGVGNTAGEEHRNGKGEININFLKSYKFGEIGIDISTGGNLIPGSDRSTENNIETLSSNDANFNCITAFYRLPIIKKIYLETRLGYSSLFYWIHADNERKISKSNISYGHDVGATLFNNLSVSLRYQNLGNTPNYEGNKNMTTIISKSEPLKLVLLRVAYRFNWDSIF